MSGWRQKNRPEQEVLAFPAESRSDAPRAAEQGTETLMAKRKSESLAGSERLMEEVCELENCKQALQRVKANKGSPGVEGMTVDELSEYLKQHGLKIGRRKPPGVPTARGASPTRPPWPSLCRMLTLPSSDSRLWSCGWLNPPKRRMRTRMSGGVAGEAGRPVPLCRFGEALENEAYFRLK